jgi:hypothetical protein
MMSVSYSSAVSCIARIDKTSKRKTLLKSFQYGGLWQTIGIVFLLLAYKIIRL